MRRTRCPKCSSRGQDKSGDNLAVYSDHEYCYACGYYKDLGSSMKRKSKKFTGFPEDIVLCEEIPYIGITKETLTYANVKEIPPIDYNPDEEYIPCSGYVLFPFYNEHKKLIGFKTRDFYAQYEEGISKNKLISVEGEQTLGGLHTYDETKQELCIWEGETDWLQALQCDKTRNHFYLPGAQTAKYIKEHALLVRKHRRIYLSGDNDEAGKSLVASCLELLPAYKTYIINYDEVEANDLSEAVLTNGNTVYDILIRTAFNPKPAGLITGKELRKSILSYYHTSSDSMVYDVGFPTINDMLGGGLAPAECVALTAETGLGKSTLTANIAWNLIEQGIKCSWFGTEMQYPQMFNKFAEIYLQKKIFQLSDGSWTASEKEIKEVLDYLQDSIVFHHCMDGTYADVKDSMLSAIYTHDVKVIFIDVLNDIPGIQEDWKQTEKILEDLALLASGDINDSRPAVSIVNVVHQKSVQGMSTKKVTADKMAGGKCMRQKHTCIIGMQGDIRDTERELVLLKRSRLRDSLTDNGLLDYDKVERRYFEVESDEHDERDYNREITVKAQTIKNEKSNRKSNRLPSRQKRY